METVSYVLCACHPLIVLKDDDLKKTLLIPTMLDYVSHEHSKEVKKFLHIHTCW